MAKKKKQTQETFKSKIQDAVYTISGKFIKTQIIKHSGSKGSVREDALIDFLSDNLPKKYSVVKGEVVDLFNTTSPQMDIMIYDNSRNIPLFTDGTYILPAEALLASIEIKSRLTLGETGKILRSVNSLKSLKPFKKGLDLVKNGRQQDEKVLCRYYHCIFAYDTDISETDWLKKEVARFRKVATDEKIEITLIDRVFVLNRGLINFAHSIGKSSNDDSETFLYFYMNLLNFLERENGRRKDVDYQEYSGATIKGWGPI